jgi:hypothetical protein
VDPVDPGAAARRIPRAGGAEDQHRHAVAPGIEDRHRGVHEADIRMQHHAHHPARGLGVTVGDRHGCLLVQAEQHLRALVAEVVDDAVMESPVARPRIQCEKRDIERTQHRGDGVATPQFFLLGNPDRGFLGHAILP